MSRFSFPDAPGDLLGAHISTKGGLPTAFERAAAINATAMAIWAKNSNQWVNKPYTDELRAEFAAKRNVAPVITHASYLINLATTNDTFHRKAAAALIVRAGHPRSASADAVVGCVDRRAPRPERLSRRRPTVVLQLPEQRIRVLMVAGLSEPARRPAVDVVAV